MKKLIVLLAGLLLVFRLDNASYSSSYHGDRVYRIMPSTSQQFDQLSTNVPYYVNKGQLDFWKFPQAVGIPVDVHVRKIAIKNFEKLLADGNFRFTTLHWDLEKEIVEVDRLNSEIKLVNGSIVGTFASHQDIATWLRQQCSTYRTITTCGSWGKTYEGRDMNFIKLGSFRNSTKPAVYIISGIHAREWLGPATIIWIVDHMLKGYDSDDEITRMIDTYDWYIEPVVNADGYEYSRNIKRLWRKTRTPVKNPHNCVGIDGNRNFDFHWSGGDSACSQTYAGPSALYDKVTENIINFMNEINKTQPGLAFFSAHTYSNAWLVPYGYAMQAYPPDFVELMRVAQIGANALMAVHNTNWKVGNIADTMYIATGNAADAVKGNNLAKYSYGMELRGNSFVVPASEIAPSGEEVFAGFMASVKAMHV